jgi:hypothetical protein
MLESKLVRRFRVNTTPITARYSCIHLGCLSNVCAAVSRVCLACVSYEALPAYSQVDDPCSDRPMSPPRWLPPLASPPPLPPLGPLSLLVGDAVFPLFRAVPCALVLRATAIADSSSALESAAWMASRCCSAVSGAGTARPGPLSRKSSSLSVSLSDIQRRSWGR